ncbi:hypothetical protein QE410_002502 [Microbacterium sp. SORGH_AS 1204]|nr:hypothetical protein [Microbacterium sp. SORGH_AS_1204]
MTVFDRTPGSMRYLCGLAESVASGTIVKEIA